jgi:hypothetical protein
MMMLCANMNLPYEELSFLPSWTIDQGRRQPSKKQKELPLGNNKWYTTTATSSGRATARDYNDG